MDSLKIGNVKGMYIDTQAHWILNRKRKNFKKYFAEGSPASEIEEEFCEGNPLVRFLHIQKKEEEKIEKEIKKKIKKKKTKKKKKKKKEIKKKIKIKIKKTPQQSVDD